MAVCREFQLLLLTCVLVHGAAVSGCADSASAPSSVTNRGTQSIPAKTPLEAVAGSVEDTTAPVRDWKFIVLHHTATNHGDVASIDAVHKARRDAGGQPWKGIGYHFLIGNGQGMPDGAVESTFRWKQQIAGAHAGQYQFNEWGIGVCLVGNFEEAPPTAAQLAAVQQLIRRLQKEFNLGDQQILRHGDLKATACPGRLFSYGKVVPGQDIRR